MCLPFKDISSSRLRSILNNAAHFTVFSSFYIITRVVACTSKPVALNRPIHGHLSRHRRRISSRRLLLLVLLMVDEALAEEVPEGGVL